MVTDLPGAVGRVAGRRLGFFAGGTSGVRSGAFARWLLVDPLGWLLMDPLGVGRLQGCEVAGRGLYAAAFA